MSSFADKIAARKFPSKDVLLSLDGELARQREDATRDLSAAQRDLNEATRNAENGTGDGRSSTSPVRRAQKAVDAAVKALNAIEAQMQDRSVTIRITGVSYGKYNSLIAKCPPRKGKSEPFNPSTFFMLAAKETGQYVDDAGSLHDLSADEWKLLESSLTDGEYDRLASAIIDVNRVQGVQASDFLSSNSETARRSSETSAQPEA